MNLIKTYLIKLMVFTAGCLFTAVLYAQEEGMEEEGMEEEGMLMEEGEELPPLYTSRIEFGFGYSSEDSFKFGEYNGLEDEGFFGIGNLLIRKNSVIGDNDNDYWELSGTNLGLDNRNIYAEYSHDGTYGEYSRNSAYSVYFEYDQIPHNQFEDGKTPFFGAGTANQTLPANWVGASSTADLTQLVPSLKNVELETERKRYGGGVKWHITDHWMAQASYRHEDKEGSDPIGALFGSSGGNPRSSVLAFPINYNFDEFDVNLAYTGEKGQYILNYHLSLFNNDDHSIVWDNPFNNGSWDAGANFDDGARGRDSLFPDNEAHQVQFSGGYNFTPKTRATATVSYSRWTQDENFLPFSNVFSAVVTLPRNNLDGEIETVFTNVNLYSRINNKLDVKARYTYEDKDNNTPQDIYFRIPGDAVEQDTADGLASERAIINRTYDLTRHQVELEGGYRITPRTKLQLAYEYERKERNFSEVNTTDEHTGEIRLSASPVDFASGWIKYQHSILDGSDYVSNRPLLSHHTPEHIAEEIADECGATPPSICPVLFENDPLLRKYHFANRDRDLIQALASFYPHEKWDFTLSGEYRNDDYDDSQLGLQESSNYNVTVDIGFHPNERFNAYAFATHENFQYDQRGYRRTGGSSPPVGPGFDRVGVGSPRGWDFWTTDTEDNINMVGTGFEWFVIEDKFKMNVDFTYSRSYTQFDQTSGPALTGGNVAEPLPDVTTRLTNLSLTGEYKFRDNMTARFGYMYERYTTEDFGLDNVEVNTLNNVILLGNSSPHYVAHVFGASIIYEFQ